jgi:6-pyruvoyltetrahydropterin/6-carboxytetrahydropterin synthase
MREDIIYQSTKTYTASVGISAAFRQWRADSHCKYLHGYALEFHFVFEAEELDHRNWVVDFGSLKDLKGRIEEMFDHKTLVAEDDPALSLFSVMHERGIIQMVTVPAGGMEKFAELIYDYANMFMDSHGYSPWCILRSVEVREHAGNSARVVRK